MLCLPSTLVRTLEFPIYATLALDSTTRGVLLLLPLILPILRLLLGLLFSLPPLLSSLRPRLVSSLRTAYTIPTPFLWAVRIDTTLVRVLPLLLSVRYSPRVCLTGFGESVLVYPSTYPTAILMGDSRGLLRGVLGVRYLSMRLQLLGAFFFRFSLLYLGLSSSRGDSSGYFGLLLGDTGRLGRLLRSGRRLVGPSGAIRAGSLVSRSLSSIRVYFRIF